MSEETKRAYTHLTFYNTQQVEPSRRFDTWADASAAIREGRLSGNLVAWFNDNHIDRETWTNGIRMDNSRHWWRVGGMLWTEYGEGGRVMDADDRTFVFRLTDWVCNWYTKTCTYRPLRVELDAADGTAKGTEQTPPSTPTPPQRTAKGRKRK